RSCRAFRRHVGDHSVDGEARIRPAGRDADGPCRKDPGARPGRDGELGARDARMRVAIVTDAWHPQINGVVRTLFAVCDGLAAAGHSAQVFGPDRYRTLPCPGYRTFRLAVGAGAALRRHLAEFAPHAVHVATEGPLGFAARAFCLARGWPFTTAYHT